MDLDYETYYSEVISWCIMEKTKVETSSTSPAKKRIKLVLSDLHLGVGRILENGQINSLEEFYFDEKLVEFLHYYTSGKYAGAQVELILNGDILNFLQVDYKGHFLTVLTEDICLDILERILKGHAQVFKALREFVSVEGNSITYVVGNHDQGMMWPALRSRLNEAVGAAINYKNLVSQVSYNYHSYKT